MLFPTEEQIVLLMGGSSDIMSAYCTRGNKGTHSQLKTAPRQTHSFYNSFLFASSGKKNGEYVCLVFLKKKRLDPKRQEFKKQQHGFHESTPTITRRR